MHKFAGVLSLLIPCLAAASQCPPHDICEITAKVLSIKEGPADEEGISVLNIEMRIIRVGKMVEKSRFTSPDLTCGWLYKKGQKIKLNRLKDNRNNPHEHDGIKPGVLLRGDIQSGCDERMSWYNFENAVIAGSTAAVAGAQNAKPGHKPLDPPAQNDKKMMTTRDGNLDAAMVASWGRQKEFFIKSGLEVIGWAVAEDVLLHKKIRGGKQYHTGWLTIYTEDGGKYLVKQPEMDSLWKFMEAKGIELRGFGTE